MSDAWAALDSVCIPGVWPECDIPLVCTMVGYSVLLSTMVYKVPQVYVVLKTGSAEGISLTSLVTEFLSYSVETIYQIAMGYPLTTYFEMFLMWGGDAVLLPIVLYRRGLLNFKLVPHFIVFVTFCFVIVTFPLPLWLMYSIYGITIPILVFSKVSLLLDIYRSKNPGVLSAVSWSLLSYNVGARLPTHYLLAYDLPKFINYIAAFVLDIAVAWSIYYYNWYIYQASRRGSRRWSRRWSRRSS